MYGVEPHDLHNWLEVLKSLREKMISKQLFRVFYSNYKERIEPIYKKFMRNVLSKIIDFPFAYQKIPTFRIGLPGNRFAGEYHSDSKYNHPDFELNFNLGLSNYLEPCLMSEKILIQMNFFLRMSLRRDIQF